jgi:hypothetical protein
MAEHNCKTCGWRAKYDEAPRSFAGRLWRWHANWCPGWKKYMLSLPDEERREMARRYGQKKYQG